MNYVIMTGILDGDAELIYESENKTSLYKFKIRILRSYKNKFGEIETDVILVKIWSDNLADESMLHDEAIIGIEGKIQSHLGKDSKNIYNEVVANRIYYLG